VCFSYFFDKLVLFCGKFAGAPENYALRPHVSPTDDLFILCVPVGFVGVSCQGQSLRLPSAATVSLRLGHTRALTTHCVVIHYPRAASLPLHNGGVVRGHRSFGELPVGFVGVDCFHGTGDPSPTDDLFILCVPVGFVGVSCQGQSLRLPSAATSLYTMEAWFEGIVHSVSCPRGLWVLVIFTGRKQITPSKRTIAVRLLSGAFPINCKHRITSRNAHPSPTDDRTFGG